MDKVVFKIRRWNNDWRYEINGRKVYHLGYEKEIHFYEIRWKPTNLNEERMKRRFRVKLVIKY